MEEGGHSQGMPLETGKRKETDYALESTERKAPLLTTWFLSW